MSQATQATATSTWTIDPAHTVVEFSVRHLMITTVKGRFGAVSGTLVLDESDITRSKVEVEIDAGSIDTREDKRDAHLRSADFFDVENHPKLTFVSRRVERSGDRLKVTGDLTIRGTTKEITLDVEDLGRVKDPWGGDRAAFTATGKLNRSEYGLTWNQALETGGVMVSDEVKLSIDAQFVRS
ncbi:MAG: YceI family protein [Candidatus Cloacimonetes bacterium]|jgi:polyisoprenoid-binding protein YceI|nr:YceI family protein [Candidatus Cloacimonadota bacterium]